MMELPALAGLWILLSTLLTLGAACQLGHLVVKSSWGYLNLMCGFWSLAFVAAILAWMGWAKPEVILGLVLCLNLWGVPHSTQFYQTFRRDLNAFILKFRETGWLYQFGLALAIMLLLVRGFRAFVPVLNWDSINQHLPLLAERVRAGNLEPLFAVSTDRRTLWGGILLKWVPMVFDPYGRTLILTHVIMVVLGCGSFLKIAIEHGQKKWPLLAIGMFLALPDLWVYVLMAGDEPWFLCFGMVWLTHHLFPDHLKCSSRENFCLMLMVALMITVKATAVFFVLPIALLGVYQYRKAPKVFVGALLASLFLIALLLGKTYSDYGMIYPLQRWSDLLSVDSPPPLFTSSEVKLGREALGLVDHHDNHSAGSQPWAMLQQNLSRFLYWPIGPYWFWALLALPWLIRRRSHFNSKQVGLVLVIFSTLLISMTSWSFSPQAITRYLLPVWFWLTVCLARVLCDGVRGSTLAFQSMKLSVLILLCYSFVIESKVLLGRMGCDASMWSPPSYWLEVCQDGPLLRYWKSMKNDKDRTFYAGSAGVLMANQGHWLAQAGNEVGWRDPQKLGEFLVREKLKWWIVARSATKVDTIYEVLSEEALAQGLLERVVELKSGVIYRVK